MWYHRALIFAHFHQPVEQSSNVWEILQSRQLSGVIWASPACYVQLSTFLCCARPLTQSSQTLDCDAATRWGSWSRREAAAAAPQSIWDCAAGWAPALEGVPVRGKLSFIFLCLNSQSGENQPDWFLKIRKKRERREFKMSLCPYKAKSIKAGWLCLCHPWQKVTSAIFIKISTDFHDLSKQYIAVMHWFCW